jgi:hypothetical protein
MIPFLNISVTFKKSNRRLTDIPYTTKSCSNEGDSRSEFFLSGIFGYFFSLKSDRSNLILIVLNLLQLSVLQ